MGPKDSSLITKAPILAHVFEVLKGCFTFGLRVVSFFFFWGGEGIPRIGPPNVAP